MEVFLVGTPLLLLGIALLYKIVQVRQKDRHIAQKDRQIEQMRKDFEGIKNRHLTAKGGLGREDKTKVLDLIAKVDALEDDSALVTLRSQDLKRELQKLLNKEK